jgi:hypothetical protein
MTQFGGSSRFVVLADGNHLDPAVRQNLARMMGQMRRSGITHLYYELPRAGQSIVTRFQEGLRARPQDAQALRAEFVATMSRFMAQQAIRTYAELGLTVEALTDRVVSSVNSLANVVSAATTAGITMRFYDDGVREYNADNYPHMHAMVPRLGQFGAQAYDDALLIDRVGRDPDAARRILADMRRLERDGITVGRVAVFPGAAHALATGGITTQLGLQSGEGVSLLLLGSRMNSLGAIQRRVRDLGFVPLTPQQVMGPGQVDGVQPGGP